MCIVVTYRYCYSNRETRRSSIDVNVDLHVKGVVIKNEITSCDHMQSELKINSPSVLQSFKNEENSSHIDIDSSIPCYCFERQRTQRQNLRTVSLWQVLFSKISNNRLNSKMYLWSTEDEQKTHLYCLWHYILLHVSFGEDHFQHRLHRAVLPSSIELVNTCCQKQLLRCGWGLPHMQFPLSTALPQDGRLGEGACDHPAELVVVSEACKDNTEQLWPWRLQIISNSSQQLVASSSPNSCHDIVLFYVSPAGSDVWLRPCRAFEAVEWMDYLLVLQLSDELQTRGNWFTSSLSSRICLFEYSGVLTRRIVQRVDFITDYQLQNRCVRAVWATFCGWYELQTNFAQVEVDRKVNTFTFLCCWEKFRGERV